ncbi:hypothetical protein Tco_0486524 [Tanacetum coccineum]
MVEPQDKQRQQQEILSVELVPIGDQVKVVIRKFRISLEKTQPDLIYKVCLEILKQYNFFNAFIATADAPEIYNANVLSLLDTTLGNLKFANKGEMDPVFGMAIPVVMLNDDINAIVEYSEYLAKSRGSKPVKTQGKGLLTKQGVEESTGSKTQLHLGVSSSSAPTTASSLITEVALQKPSHAYRRSLDTLIYPGPCADEQETDFP